MKVKLTLFHGVRFEIVHIFIPGVLQEDGCFEDHN